MMHLHSMTRWLQRPRTMRAPSARDAYDLWSDSYPASAHNPLMRAEQSIVEPLLSRLTASSALDIGTGSGRYLPVLARTGAARVVGVDLSLAMLRRHTAAFARTCADALRLPFRDGTFDLVMSSLMAGDVEDLRAVIREMSRVLAPGGQLVYSDFHPSWSAQGWRRTFKAQNGATIEVPYFAHAMDEHVAAVGQANLRMVAIREPRLAAEDTRSRLERRRWAHLPVLVIVHAAKPRRGLAL